jgi:hypothetical protein
MEEIEASFSEISSTNKNTRKKKKQLEEEENEKIKQISERMNDILSNNYQAITDSVNISSESEVDKMFRKNMIINERIIVIDMMLKLYPQLEKDRKHILEKVLCTAEQKIELYVLDKIKIDDTRSFYKDSQGYIIDENINVVGLCIKEDNRDKYIVFSDVKKLSDIKNKGTELIEKIDKHFNMQSNDIFAKIN